jgi:hypothetical protein
MPYLKLSSRSNPQSTMAAPRLRRNNNGSFSKQLRMSVAALAIFLLGYALGSYHSQGTNIETRTSLVELLNDGVPSSTGCGKTSSHINDNNQGWKSIEVFYGKTQDLENERSKWHSQATQDRIVISLLRDKREGFFIDLAANDARKLSNTYALERRFGWQGLCIEPNPEYWFDLSRFRTCKVVAAIVGQDRMEEIKFNYRGVYGGINREDFDNGEEYKTESIPAFTVPLQEVLERTDTPRVIDYLSLDVEGAEAYIMKNFPLSSYRIKIMTVERPDNELLLHLLANGFKLMGDISHFGETLWIHNDFVSGLDLSILDEVFKAVARKKRRIAKAKHGQS